MPIKRIPKLKIHFKGRFFYRVLDFVEKAGNLLPHPTSLFAMFALIVSFVQRYTKEAGIGTVIATMLPFTVAFLVAWSLLLVGWLLVDLPMGPGAGLYLNE